MNDSSHSVLNVGEEDDYNEAFIASQMESQYLNNHCKKDDNTRLKDAQIKLLQDKLEQVIKAFILLV